MCQCVLEYFKSRVLFPVALVFFAANVWIAASAAPIEDFRTEQQLVADAHENPAADVITSSGSLGGTRAVQFFLEEGPSSELTIKNGLRVKDSPTSRSALFAVWDGDSDPSNIKANGLGAVNFLADGNDAISIEVQYFDKLNKTPLRFVLTVFDSADNSGKTFSAAELVIDQPQLQRTLTIPYTKFTTVGEKGGANFNRIGALTLFVAARGGTGADYTLGSISRCSMDPAGSDPCHGLTSVTQDEPELVSEKITETKKAEVVTRKLSPEALQMRAGNTGGIEPRAALTKADAAGFQYRAQTPREHLVQLEKNKSGKQTKKDYEESFVPGVIAVKFKDTLSASASSIVRRGRKFSEFFADKSPKIDRANAKFKLRSSKIRPVFRSLREEQQLESAAGGAPVARSTIKSTWQKKVHNLRGRQASRRFGVKESETKDLSHIYALEFDSEDLDQVVQAYSEDSNVAWAQRVYRGVSRQAATNVPYYESSGAMGFPDLPDQWGLQQIEAADVWPRSEGQGTIVAVVDSGVDAGHPELQGRVNVAAGYNTVLDNRDTNDTFGHGTAVAGIIAATGTRMIGVAPQTTILPVKVFPDGSASGSWVDFAEGIRYAVDTGASVVNLSLGCGQPCPQNFVAEEAVEYAYDNGVTVVIAAGNSAQDTDYFSPENLLAKKPIVVAAGTPTGFATWFSSFGQSVDLIAPGGGLPTQIAHDEFDYGPQSIILSLKSQTAHPDMIALADDPVGKVLDAVNPEDPLLTSYGYLRTAGTSFSAPYVSGVAALVLSLRPTLTPQQLRQALRTSATDVVGFGVDWGEVYSPGFDMFTGMGVVNAKNALDVSKFSELAITSPVFNSYIGVPPEGIGQIPIRGTAAGEDFASYRLLFRAIPGGAFTALPAVTAPKRNEILGYVPGDLDYGRYQVKLEVTTTTGKSFDDGTNFVIERPSQIINTSLGQGEPLDVAVSGNLIIWRQARGGVANKFDVFEHDLSLGRTSALTTATTSSGVIDGVSVDGTRIAWHETLANGQNVIRVLTKGSGIVDIAVPDIHCEKPKLSGALLVFEGWNADRTTSAAYKMNLTSDTAPSLVSISSNNQREPSVSGTRILWHEIVNEKGQLYVLDLSTGQKRKIGADSVFFPPSGRSWGIENRIHGSISGNYVVYETTTVGSSDTDVLLINLTNDSEIFINLPGTTASNQSYPSISSNVMTWLEAGSSSGSLAYQKLPNDDTPQLGYSGLPMRAVGLTGERVAFSREGKLFTALLNPAGAFAVGELSAHTISEGETLGVTLRVTKPEGSPAVSFNNTLPPGATFDPATARFSWTPPYDTATRGATVSLSATFAVSLNGATITRTMPITVQDKNAAPDITGIIVGTNFGPEGTELAYDVVVSDPEKEPVRVWMGASALTPTPVLTITSTSAEETGAKITWTPPPGSSRQFPPYHVPIYAEDPAGNRSVYGAYFWVDPPQVLPVFTGNYPDIVTDAHRQYSLRVTAGDGNSDASVEDELNLTVTGLPSDAVITGGTSRKSLDATVTWTAKNDMIGVRPVVLTVTKTPAPFDPRTVSASKTFNLTVNRGLSNAAPTLTTAPRHTLRAGRVNELTFNAVDSDGDPLSCTFTTLPAGAELNSAECRLSWTPTAAQLGDHPIAIQVTDGVATAQANTILEVIPNRLPVVSTQNPYLFYEYGQGSYTLAVSDADGDAVTLNGVSLPTGATIDPNTFVLAWKPDAGRAGNYTAIVEASDGVGASQTTLNLQVLANRLPVFNGLGDRSVKVNGTLKIIATATDPDGDPVTYIAPFPKPLSATFNTTTAEFSWTPNSTEVGTRVTGFRARDNKNATATQRINITVKANQSPLMSSPGDKTVQEMAALQFSLGATDPDGHALTYSALNLPQGATLNPTTGDFSWTPSYAQSGTYNVSFSVTDGTANEPGPIVTRAVTITVTDVPQPPVAPSMLRTSAVAARSATLAWTDNSNDETGFELQQSAAVAGPFLTVATTAANVTTHTLNTLAPDYTYYFRVRSVRGTALSDWTSLLPVRTKPEIPPAPQGLTASLLPPPAGITPVWAVRLTWLDRSSNEGYFAIYGKPPGTANFIQLNIVPPNTTLWSHIQVPSGTWQYYVKAINNFGASTSNTVSITVPGSSTSTPTATPMPKPS